MGSGTLNSAIMHNLQPGTRYYYMYGDDKLGRSQEHSFMTAPAVGAASTVGVLMTADMVRIIRPPSQTPSSPSAVICPPSRGIWQHDCAEPMNQIRTLADVELHNYCRIHESSVAVWSRRSVTSGDCLARAMQRWMGAMSGSMTATRAW